MDVKLTIVPPGGGEADHSVDVDMQAAPRVGEYLHMDYGEDGALTFRVLYITHHLRGRMYASDSPADLIHTDIEAQIEPVHHAGMGEGRARRLFDAYASDPRWAEKVQSYPESGGLSG